MEDIVTSLAKEDIKLLDNEELLKQMAHFVVVKRKNGNYSYENDRTDIHDDAVMATAIAYNCFKKKHHINHECLFYRINKINTWKNRNQKEKLERFFH